MSAYIFLTLIVPSQAIIAPLGTVGAPSTIVAILVFAWWIWDHVHRARPGQPHAQWVRRCAIGLLLLMVIVYRHAMMQPMVADEIISADSGLIRFAALIGVLLTASDGLSSTRRWHQVLSRVSNAGIALSILALLQFLTGELWIDRFTIPGLTNAGTVDALLSRGSFLRPSGTSSHPIEFGAVLGIILPIAVTRARIATTHRFANWAGVTVMLLVVLVSISRTVLICTAIGFLILIPGWSRSARRVALGVGAVLFAAAALAIPGLMGTLRGLFQGSADDPSIQSRTAGYGYAWEMFTHNPWLGRGYGTFSPRYYIFDNGYLQLLMEAGALGVMGFLALLVSAMVAARRAERIFVRREDREMCRALLAAVAAGAVCTAFFDLFAFPQSAACLVLVIGLCGAALRLARTAA